MLAQAHPGIGSQRLGEQAPPGLERFVEQRPPVEPQQVEDLVHERRRRSDLALALDAGLEEGEIGLTTVVERNDLSVDDRLARSDPRWRREERSEVAARVLLAAGPDPHLVAIDDGLYAEAVPLDLELPVRVVERRGHEGGQHRWNEAWHRVGYTHAIVATSTGVVTPRIGSGRVTRGGDQPLARLGDRVRRCEDLAATRERADACGDVDRDPAVVRAALGRIRRMQADPHCKFVATAVAVIAKRLLDRDRGLDRGARRLERGEEPVAGRVDDLPPASPDHPAQRVIVPAQESLPGVVAECFGKTRRTHDVGEHEGPARRRRAVAPFADLVQLAFGGHGVELRPEPAELLDGGIELEVRVFLVIERAERAGEEHA